MLPLCSAHSKQTGQPCKVRVVPGATVCRFHGGSAPQVRLKAEERLQAARDRMLEIFLPIALTRLQALLEDPLTPPAVLKSAVADLLDRVGLGATQKTEATVTTHAMSDMDRDIAELMGRLGKSADNGQLSAHMDSQEQHQDPALD